MWIKIWIFCHIRLMPKILLMPFKKYQQDKSGQHMMTPLRGTICIWPNTKYRVFIFK